MMYFVGAFGASSDSELPHCREKEIVTIWSFFLQLPQVASSWECLIFKDLNKSKSWRFTVWFYSLVFTMVWSISNNAGC